MGRFDTIEQRQSRKERRAEKFSAILSRFRREFGPDNIWFELLDYETYIGICIESGREDELRRIAIRFTQKDGVDCLNACVAYGHSWIAGETDYKGVLNDNTLEGQELSASGILQEVLNGKAPQT